MHHRETKLKAASVLAFLVFLLITIRVSAVDQARTKKEIMVEMGKIYSGLDQKISGGVNAAKFSDAEYAEVGAQCDALTKLSNDYAKLEGKSDLNEIAKSLASTSEYLKQQIDRKDPVVMASTFGRVLSYCAECHYATRW